MNEDQSHLPTATQPTRRDVLVHMGSAAVIGMAAASFANAQQSSSPASDSDTHNSSSTPPSSSVAENPELIQQNPSTWTPPHSDSGDVNNFRYPFAFGHNRVSNNAGWARQVTVRDLPISKTIAGVNMHLEPYAVRELHWHIPAEWAFMLKGSARITGVDGAGHAQVTDVGVGDLWYFPGGIPHSIQGLENGCEFLLVFDDGKFSEFDTFLITDWFAHTPPDVLARNFDWPPDAISKMPKKELYIFNAPKPRSLDEDRKLVTGNDGTPPDPFDFRLLAMQPTKTTKGGELRIVDSNSFKVSKTVAAAHVRLKPGALREMHWHPNADEWTYFIKGDGRMTLFTGGGKARTIDFHPGDVGYIEQSLPHYIENTGSSDMEFLEMFKSDHYDDISAVQWVSHLPPELVAAHLRIDESLVRGLSKDKAVIVPT